MYQPVLAHDSRSSVANPSGNALLATAVGVVVVPTAVALAGSSPELILGVAGGMVLSAFGRRARSAVAARRPTSGFERPEVASWTSDGGCR